MSTPWIQDDEIEAFDASAAELALSEARMILAETERPVRWHATGLDATWPPDGFMAAHVCTLRPGCGKDAGEYGIALAEALARFIEQEF